MTNQQIEFHAKLKVAIRPVVSAITPKWPNKLFTDEELATYQKFNRTAWYGKLKETMLDVLGLDIGNVSTVYTMAKAAHYSNEPQAHFVAALSSALARAYVMRAGHRYRDVSRATFDVSRGTINMDGYSTPTYVPTELVRKATGRVPKFVVTDKMPYMGLEDVMYTMSKMKSHLDRTTRKGSMDVTREIEEILEELKPFVSHETYSMLQRTKSLHGA